ncbi:Ubiquinone biosynthesis protein [Spiromyces aspiralis]|uniref:Ubiquinone biosynthesis protein n=1 Tax=Spiromyces aspiralis TaxID=68401 RepID=A0ACC1HSE8_9FUNG|nr:Ubiquinone biosynthesis protein [Spiromyces aspiralis]
MRDIMLRDPEGRQILKERPLVQFTPSEYEGLGKKSPDSFGYAYYHSMRSQGISWETRTKVQYVDDEELAYMMTRHRQIHDFYHTLLGLKIKILDELTLKCFEFAQTGLPVGMLAGLFGSLRLPPDQKLAFYTVYAPWAVRSGAQARPLFNVFWEKHWDTPIVELRRQLNVSLPPDLS